jgi:cyclohexanone monooxygenase
MGLRAQVLEAGSSIGGTWFWNRYPGARCDVESLEYSYSFSDELQQEWVWPERFAAQPDILRYINHVADRLALRPFILTDARVVSAVFDRGTDLWTVTTAGEGFPGPVLHHGDGQSFVASGASLPGIGELQGQLVPQRALAGEGVDFSGGASA